MDVKLGDLSASAKEKQRGLAEAFDKEWLFHFTNNENWRRKRLFILAKLSVIDPPHCTYTNLLSQNS